MAKKAHHDDPVPQDDAGEGRDWYVLAQDVQVRGLHCEKGGRVALTADEAAAMKTAGVRFEGEEEPTPEEVQAKHDEGAAAQRKEAAERPIRDEKARLDARMDELEHEQAALKEKEAELPALED